MTQPQHLQKPSVLALCDLAVGEHIPIPSKKPEGRGVWPYQVLSSDVVDGLIRLHLRCSTTGATMCMVGSPASTITRLPTHLPVCQHCGQLAPCTATDHPRSHRTDSHHAKGLSHV